MHFLRTCFLFVVLFTCQKEIVGIHQCPEDTVDLATKIANSSIVVYGKSIGKALYDGNDEMFYVTYQVDCILKGPPTAKLINITRAGEVEGQTFCQDFPVGRGHSLAFLEPNPENVNDTQTFVPADFVEVDFVRNVTSELLVDTCGLRHVLPLNSSNLISNVCPVVSTSARCAAMEATTIILNPVVISGGAHVTVDNIRSKSGSVQVGVDVNRGNTKPVSILLTLLALVFIRWN